MYKNIAQIPVFIYGATVLALGLAHQLKAEAVVIEKSGFVGREFIDCYNPGDNFVGKQFGSDAEDLKNELMKRNILFENRMHIQGAAPVLFNRIKGEKLNFLFMTVVTGIKPIQGGYEVTVHNNSGFRKFHAAVVIDTTSLCETAPAQKKDVKSKSINAALSPVNRDFKFPVPDNPLVRLIQGRFDDEVYLKYPLNNEDDWVTSREKFHKYWVTRQGDLKGWNMSALASSYEIKVNTKSEQIDSNWFWMPSGSHDNLLEAYESGIYTRVPKAEWSEPV